MTRCRNAKMMVPPAPLDWKPAWASIPLKPFPRGLVPSKSTGQIRGKEKVRYVITALLSKVIAPILCNNQPHDFHHVSKQNSEGIRVA